MKPNNTLSSAILAISFISCVSPAFAKTVKVWNHVGTEYKTDPLNCNVPKELLDWAEPPSENIEGQPYVGAVKYQSGQDGRADNISLHAWTDPVLKPDGVWYIYLTSWKLLGSPGALRISAKVQEKDEDDPRRGVPIAEARLTGDQRKIDDAVKLDPESGLRVYDDFQVRLIVSNGGACSEGNVGRFFFGR